MPEKAANVQCALLYVSRRHNEFDKVDAGYKQVEVF